MTVATSTDNRLPIGTQVRTNVALTGLHRLRSLSANIGARTVKAVGLIRGSHTWNRHKENEDVVYHVEHVAGDPLAHYRRNEFDVIAGADQGELEGCIIMTFASAKAELEALEEILAKHYCVDSHVRERLIQLDVNGDMNEDDPMIGHVVCAWQEALTTYVNWPEDDMDENAPVKESA